MKTKRSITIKYHNDTHNQIKIKNTHKSYHTLKHYMK